MAGDVCVSPESSRRRSERAQVRSTETGAASLHRTGAALPGAEQSACQGAANGAEDEQECRNEELNEDEGGGVALWRVKQAEEACGKRFGGVGAHLQFGLQHGCAEAVFNGAGAVAIAQDEAGDAAAYGQDGAEEQRKGDAHACAGIGREQAMRALAKIGGAAAETEQWKQKDGEDAAGTGGDGTGQKDARYKAGKGGDGEHAQRKRPVDCVGRVTKSAVGGCALAEWSFGLEEFTADAELGQAADGTEVRVGSVDDRQCCFAAWAVLRHGFSQATAVGG